MCYAKNIHYLWQFDIESTMFLLHQAKDMTQTPKQVTPNELTQDNNQSGEGKWSSEEQEVRMNMLHAFVKIQLVEVTWQCRINFHL